jgi:dTDP-4-amino-4,6-dideoxygalactose transaminase
MTEIQAALGRHQLKKLNRQILVRNEIANIYLNELKDYYSKYNLLQKPNFKCQSCPLKQRELSCNRCLHAFYRLNLFINPNKINQIELIQQLNNKKINCGVGSCPEIYREKVFKKFSILNNKRLLNAKQLGETSLVFPINPFKKKSLI